MADVLVYIEPGAVSDGRADRLLAFARPLATACGGDLVALAAGAESPAAGALAAADVVLEATHPALAPYLPEAHGAVLAAAIETRRPDLVVVESSTAGYDLAAGAAAATRRPLLAGVVGLSVSGASAEATCGIYGGALLATARAELPAVAAIAGTALTGDSAPAGRGERVALAAPEALGRLRTRFLEAIEPSHDGVDLAGAERIVCVGRGIGGAENIELAQELADALGAELAASRPVVDSGWLPKAHQVGKSGATVHPKLYLTLGVSGAPEHVEGMQGAELILAINKDPSAAIFNIAHYGVVADLFDVADELTARLG